MEDKAKIKRKEGATEPAFDLYFRRTVRVSALFGFFALLVVYVGLGREVNATWLFLIGGMFGIDTLTSTLRGRG